ncbi:MAG: S-layer homology domain-containing protein [Bacteroidales bacterium]|nr:S-layer homology domain-containing protein [Bacteroidales bacterium]
MANALVGALNALAVKANPAFKSNRSESIKEGYTTGWGAVRYPELGGVKGMLLEVNFHENPAIAEWIIANSDPIGKTIAQTIAKELKLSKKEQPKPTTRFSDVPKSHWAYDHIENLANLDIVKGYTDGTFRPNEPITRAHVCKIVDLAMKKK